MSCLTVQTPDSFPRFVEIFLNFERDVHIMQERDVDSKSVLFWFLVALSTCSKTYELNLLVHLGILTY